MLSGSKKVFQVCIVGAGPAGFYAAMHITKKLKDVHIDIIEKLPVPFGLIRYGVAPDHPEVKNVINQFTKVAQQSNVKFYGNITLGQDIKLDQLKQHYDAVLLAYGAEQDNSLGIENEDAVNVVAARRFVGWYNGLPSEKDLKVDLSSHTAVVVGCGNVAVDVARVLLSPVDRLARTDIAHHALDQLAESRVREICMVARRGPLQAAFTIAELRELLALPQLRALWRATDFHNVRQWLPQLPRPRKRLTELMLKSLDEGGADRCGCGALRLRPVFLRSPTRFLLDDSGRLSGVHLTCNRLVGDTPDTQTCVPTEDTEVIPCGLAFRSIGYRSVSAEEGIRLADGVLANDRGRAGKGLYTAGWLGAGAAGVILHTMANSFQVARTMLEDLANETERAKPGFEEVKKILAARNVPYVDWEGWLRIDKCETERGKAKGKPREKIVSIDEMIEVARSVR